MFHVFFHRTVQFPTRTRTQISLPHICCCSYCFSFLCNEQRPPPFRPFTRLNAFRLCVCVCVYNRKLKFMKRHRTTCAHMLLSTHKHTTGDCVCVCLLTGNAIGPLWVGMSSRRMCLCVYVFVLKSEYARATSQWYLRAKCAHTNSQTYSYHLHAYTCTKPYCQNIRRCVRHIIWKWMDITHHLCVVPCFMRSTRKPRRE